MLSMSDTISININDETKEIVVKFSDLRFSFKHLSDVANNLRSYFDEKESNLFFDQKKYKI